MINPFEEIERRLQNLEQIVLANKNAEFAREKQDNVDRLLTMKEAADYMHLAKQTVYGKVSRGELPVYKPAGSKFIYFSKEDLDNYLKSNYRKSNDAIKSEASDYLVRRKRA